LDRSSSADDTPRRRETIERLLEWGRANRRDFPWRGEADPFRVLIAEVLLQRSRGRTVAAVYTELFERWPGARSLAEAAVEDIRDVIRPLGLVRRAESISRLAAEVVERGTVPRSIEELTDLPGIGTYAAHATAVACFGARVPTVDAVSARVYRRVLGIGEFENSAERSVDDGLLQSAQELIPRYDFGEWNWAVLDLAAVICLPKRPLCGNCPLEAVCAMAVTAT
jgi:A/G-specific adenine glycosylase